MLINIIGVAAILLAVAGAIAYLAKKHQLAKKTGGHSCVGCSCGCASKKHS